jgi:A/G-specific adenine glycosylase
MAENNIKLFQKLVWRHYKKEGRHTLPWRETKDPYRILVSEVMLQQTQVDRVIPFYNAFLQKFPTARALARAPLADVLCAWQGLGYNRRARMLQSAAKEAEKGFPKTREGLEVLSGVGPYTARAVSVFAYGNDEIVIETNIRTAVIHHFFTRRNTTIYGSVSDAEIEEVLARVLPKGKSREWYSALMDYGAHLKRSGISHNAKSKTYTKQSVFKGSLREARGAILRALSKKPEPFKKLTSLLGDSRKEQMKTALTALKREGFVVRKKRKITLA